MQEEVVEAYRDYEFHPIYQKVHNFCVVELGAFWLDILKDRLYTTPAKSAGAPLCADGDVPHRRGDGALARADPVVHGRGNLEATCRARATNPSASATWWKLPAVQTSDAIDWDAVIALKTDVSRELERLRTAGELGAPLEAAVDVYLDEAQHRRMAGIGDELRFVLITSSARMRPADERPADGCRGRHRSRRTAPGSRVHVQDPAPKCARCWHRARRRRPGSASTRRSAAAASANLDGPGETRRFA